MSSISAGMPAVAESVAAYGSTSKTGSKSRAEEKKEELAVTKKADESGDTAKKTRVSGRTIGTPELSEKAAKYYDELRKKYGNMDFILVSRDQKEYAKATASSYSNPNRMVVLIDEDKIERMAEDENYRRQYEGIISQGASGLSQLKARLDSAGIGVKNYGMQINDNGASSFFATMDQSFKTQGKLAQERLAKKKAAKKAEEKRAKAEAARKKEDEKKLQEKLEEGRVEIKDTSEDTARKDGDIRDMEIAGDETTGYEITGYEITGYEITFTANSIDELIKNIENMDYRLQNGQIVSENERKVGGRFNYSV